MNTQPGKIGGIYKHYKRGTYKILNLAMQDGSMAPVVYQDIENPEKIWVRAQKEFLNDVEYENKIVSRFKLLE